MTLSELYTQRLIQLNSDNDKLNTDLTDANNALLDQNQRLRFWTDRASELNSDIDRAEHALQGVATVAEIESIAGELRHLKINSRATQHQMALAQDQHSETTTSIKLLIERLEELKRELSSAEESLEAATQIEEKHQSWFDAIGITPLASVPTDADDLLTGLVQDALDQLEAQTSTEFVALLSNRVQRYWQRLDDLRQKSTDMTLGWDANWVKQYGLEGDVDVNSRLFDQAESDLESFVANSQSILESAEARASKVLNNEFLNAAQKVRFDTLMAVGDISTDVLVPEAELRSAGHELIIRQRELAVVKAIARANDPAVSDADLDDVAEVKAILDGTDGKDSPADMQVAYDNALNAIGSASFTSTVDMELVLESANTVLQEAIKQFQIDNPDDDAEVAPELNPARDAVTDAEADLAAAVITMRDTAWYQLEEIEVAIPDTSWANAMFLVRAQIQLEQLKDADLAALETNVNTANANLATAISEQSKTDDGFLQLNQLINAYSEIHDNALAKGSDAAFGTARGQI